MKNLDGKVPYSIIPGNHDSDKTSSNKSGFAMYNKYFPVSRFSKYSWYKGNFDNNQNNYELINTGGMSLLFINLQIEPSDEAIAWANTIAKSYPNAYTIVTTHKYLHDSISTLNETRSYSVSGNTGVNIWNKLIKTNCSIKMVLSGHYHVTDGENMINTKNACGDSVAQIVQDYQGRDKGGNGLLRIFTFRPKERRIEVSTYSPYTNTFEEDENSKFTIDLI
jgi:calcineurin-like phosphoesterase family protein